MSYSIGMYRPGRIAHEESHRNLDAGHQDQLFAGYSTTLRLPRTIAPAEELNQPLSDRHARRLPDDAGGALSRLVGVDLRKQDLVGIRRATA